MSFGQAIIIGFGLCIGKFLFDFLCAFVYRLSKYACKKMEKQRNELFDRHPDFAESLGYRKMKSTPTCNKIGFDIEN